MERFVEAVFLQGDDGWTIVDQLMNTEGVVMHGATDESIVKACEALAEYVPDELDHLERHTFEELEARMGTHDRVVRNGDYVMNWHTGLGYIGLAVKVDN
ncbi:MAG TPA: hypothetical protein VLZ78_04080 [Terrimesophilobacter sp.]|nr:hypothetical protein [Terrimesophilobacter sp.]